MNIKKLDLYKKEMLELVDILPLSSMEFDIKNCNDLLIKNLYNSLGWCCSKIDHNRVRSIFHKTGIAGIYVFFDQIYSDPLKHIIYNTRKIDNFDVKNPKNWRCNQNIKEM